jgi:hypothetical protein
MTVITPAGATIPGVTHHQADVNGTQLHYGWLIRSMRPLI